MNIKHLFTSTMDIYRGTRNMPYMPGMSNEPKAKKSTAMDVNMFAQQYESDEDTYDTSLPMESIYNRDIKVHVQDDHKVRFEKIGEADDDEDDAF